MKKTESISATINQDVIIKAKELAKQERRSFSQMLNLLIELGLKYFKK